MRHLQGTVDRLTMQVSEQQERMEELSNRVFVLSDQLDSARVELSRQAIAPPALEVVRLEPAKPEPEVEEPEPESYEPPVVIAMGSSGDLEALPVTEVAPPPQRVGVERQFRNALAAYREGRVEVAFKRFAEFARRFPKHAYADNAVYWMGECRYDAKEYRQAVAEFGKVIERYPKSNKVPDALLKMALAYERLGEKVHARRVFEQVIAGYPRSALADLARSHLRAGGGKR